MAKNGQYTRLGSRTSFVIQAGENDFWIFLDSKLNLCSTLRSTLTTVTDFFPGDPVYSCFIYAWFHLERPQSSPA